MFEIKIPSPTMIALRITASLVDPARRGSILGGRLPTISDIATGSIDILEQIDKAARRKDFFAPGEMVRVVTAGDNNVCEACEDLAEGSPYTIEEAREQLPHHHGCRCKVRPLFSIDRPWLDPHPYKGVRKTFQKFRRGMRIGQRRTAQVMSLTDSDAPKAKISQRGATILRLRKKGTRFVAPSGSRSAKLKRRRGR